MVANIRATWRPCPSARFYRYPLIERIYCAVVDSGLRLTSCAETAPKKCHQTMEDRYVRQTTRPKCQRKREPCNFRSDSEAKPAEDECRLVAESVGPLGAPPAFAPVQSDGRGLRLRRTV